MEQVLYGLLDLGDSLGDIRRQLAYEDNDGDQGSALAQNGGGIFALMATLYRAWEDRYDDNPVYLKDASDSEYVHRSDELWNDLPHSRT